MTKGALVCLGKQSIADFTKPGDFKVGYITIDGRQHIDPEFNGFTYCDNLEYPRAINLGKLKVGDYIFFVETFADKRGEKRKCIFAYFKLKEITTINDVFRRGLTVKYPYLYNDHVKHGEKTSCTLFVGDPDNSKKLSILREMDLKLIEKINLRDRRGNPICKEFGKKKNKTGRLMTPIEVVNVYIRTVKLLSEDQVKFLLRARC